MNLQRIFAVVGARNREFYRDKAGLGWNLLLPFVLVLGLAFIFSGPENALYKVGVLGAPADTGQTGFLATRHIRFIAQDDEAAAIEKVRYHRIDLLVDLRDPARYWVNDLSPSGYLAERLLLQSFATTPDRLQREAVSGLSLIHI
mgnify:CR=1 FL=1